MKIIDNVISIIREKLYTHSHPDSDKVLAIIKKIRQETDMLLDNLEVYHIYTMVRETEKIKGDIAEIGVYKGGSAKIICEVNKKRSVHLFDTFAGLPLTDKKNDPPVFCEGKYYANYEGVKNYLKQYSKVHIYRGLFPSTAGPIKDHKFSFVHLDADIYESTLNGLGFFYPRMSSGGIIIAHDYPIAGGVKKAFDDFFKDKKEIIIPLPGTWQCLVVKI